MRAYRLTLGVWIMGALFAPDATPFQSVPEPRPASPASLADELDKATASLRQVADDLSGAVKLFQTHLDREIAVHDRGYRTESGRRIPGADDDLAAGLPSELGEAAVRKLFAGRMIAARRPGYEPVPLSDSDRIQSLIAEARSRIAVGNGVMRRFFVIPAKELSSRSTAELKAKRQEWLKARYDAEEAAKKAFVALPAALPAADSAQQQRDRAWDLMVTKLPRDAKPSGEAPDSSPAAAGSLPLRFENGKRITLLNQLCCRVTLTDSGMEDAQGRHLFYQEEWVRRPGNQARGALSGAARIAILMRWAVAVNPATGQHTLLRRYAPREMRGDFDDLYRLQGTDYSLTAELPARSAPVSTPELISALAAVDRSRQELQDAIAGFQRQVRDALARNDSLLAGRDQLPLDDELSNELRQRLFAIRSRLAAAPVMLDAENNIRRAAERAAVNVRTLEALVAWVNGNVLERDTPAPDSHTLLDALNRSDDAIHGTRALAQEALAALPPDVSTPSGGQFPALKKDVIVRIRRQESAAGTVRCRQETWGFSASVRGAREVKRTIVSIDIDPKSGSQIPAGREVKYYRIDPGEVLEEIYDQNAAQ
jgi:hypothetical protein